MFCNKTLNDKINKIHKRLMKLILIDYESDFIKLLEKSNDIFMHQRFIYFLMIEIYKFLNGTSPHIMNDIFILRQNVYNI